MTKENGFYLKLRSRWQEAKKLSEQDDWKAAYKEALSTGIKCSLSGFVFVKMQMEALGLEGTPYIDTKTFAGWRNSGFRVKKGEHSKLDGITFLDIGAFKEKKDGGEVKETGIVVPRAYRLFHISQVEPIRQ